MFEEDCFNIGINGGCGINCPVFLDGKCTEYLELIEDVEESKKEEILFPYKIRQNEQFYKGYKKSMKGSHE